MVVEKRGLEAAFFSLLKIVAPIIGRKEGKNGVDKASI